MPQGFDEATNAINDHFADAWETGPYSSYPIAFRNVEAEDYSKRQLPWVRITAFEGIGERISLGVEGCHRFSGTITVQVFVRPGQGTALAHTMADIAADYLRVQQIEEGNSGLIRTRTPSTPAQGIIINGWYQVNVSVSFFRDTRAGGVDVDFLIADDTTYLITDRESELLEA